MFKRLTLKKILTCLFGFGAGAGLVLCGSDYDHPDPRIGYLINIGGLLLLIISVLVLSKTLSDKPLF